MLHRIVVALALTALVAAAPAAAQDCLHGRQEKPADRDRRTQALHLARAINAAEAIVIGPMPRMFRPLDRLLNVPPTPRGFTVHFYLDADAASYLFSIRDMLDPCRYTIFSDQDGRTYEGTALGGPFILKTGADGR